MSENLDFGAKSVLRAHLLKKKYISAPFNFTHVAHVGLDRLDLDLPSYETVNNRPNSNNNIDKLEEMGSVNDIKIRNSNLEHMATDNYKMSKDEGNMSKNEDFNNLKPSITKRMHHSKSFPKFNFKLTKDDISEPFDFVHISHVGLDDIFEHENVKCETINNIIKEAGVTDKQLRDPETRKFIIDFLKSHRKSIIEEQEELRQPFERLRKGVSASFRVTESPPIIREERYKLTRHLSLNEYNFDRTTIIKPVPPKKPPRLSIRKKRENNEQ